VAPARCAGQRTRGILGERLECQLDHPALLAGEVDAAVVPAAMPGALGRVDRLAEAFAAIHMDPECDSASITLVALRAIDPDGEAQHGVRWDRDAQPDDRRRRCDESLPRDDARPVHLRPQHGHLHRPRRWLLDDGAGGERRCEIGDDLLDGDVRWQRLALAGGAQYYRRQEEPPRHAAQQ
jgi:hypothetical protein